MELLFRQLLFPALLVSAFSSDTARYIPSFGEYGRSSITPGCHQACADLSVEFGSALHYPDSDTNFTIWDEKQQEVRPACRVEPSNTAEVSKVMSILVGNWCGFAIKGGGHSRAKDASNSVGGVTVDMNKINTVEISEDRNRVRLGAGLTLGQVYRALEPYNLSNVGGRVDDVGLAGFSMGGGFSNLAPQFGLAVDNIFEYEVVLSNSSIVTVNENENPDLYFALRGGMNNFGIITYFLVRAVPQGPMLGGQKVYNSTYTDQILEQAYKLTTEFSSDTYMTFWTRYRYDQPSDRFEISVSQTYYEPVLRPQVFDQVNQIPYQSSTVRIDRMSNFALDNVSPHGLRRLYATFTYFPSQALDKRVLETFQEEVQTVKNESGFAPAIVIQPIHANAIKAMKERGGNALGIDVEGPLTLALLTFGWSTAESDKAMYDFADRWLSRSKSIAAEMGLLYRFIYINYAKDDQDPFSGYGENNKARLQNIQRAVDPIGVFTSNGLCRGLFKLL